MRATLSSFVSSYLSRPLLAMIHHILFITHHMTEYSPLNLGNIREYHPSHITQFSNLTSTMKIQLKTRESLFCGCYRRREICFFFVISQSWEITIKNKAFQSANTSAVRINFFTRVAKYLKDDKHNNLYFARKYARIFVLGHNLVLEAHSFASWNRLCPQTNILLCFRANRGYCLFIVRNAR